MNKAPKEEGIVQEIMLLVRQYGDLNYEEAYADCQESEIRSTKAANRQKEILKSIEEKLRKFVERSPITPERFDTMEQAVWCATIGKSKTPHEYAKELKRRIERVHGIGA